jgi:hypothetical protein
MKDEGGRMKDRPAEAGDRSVDAENAENGKKGRRETRCEKSSGSSPGTVGGELRGVFSMSSLCSVAKRLAFKA